MRNMVEDRRRRSRRDERGRASGSLRASALLATVALVLAACGGDDGGAGSAEDDGSAGGGSASSAAAVFVHAGDDEPGSLDPAEEETGETGETMIYQVYERLLEISPDGPDLVPGLATEIPTPDNGLISDDKLTYTFPLRDGVVFHDGTPFNAEAVKFSWDRVVEMDLPGSSVGFIADNVAEVRVVDDLTVEVELLEPNAGFLNSVVVNPVASIVSPTAVEENGGVAANTPNEFMTSNMVGTGAYRFVEWNRGENLRFEIFEDYWGEPARMNYRFDIVTDPDVRILGLQAGEYDTIETDPSLVPDLEGAPGVRIDAEGLLLEPIHIGFNLNAPRDLVPEEDTVAGDFFADVNVRKGFTCAFDYEGFLAGALGGYGDFNPHYLPIGIFGTDLTAPIYAEQDYECAEAAFRAAGVWDEGFTVSVITEAANLFETAALVLKDSIEGLNENFSIRVLAQAEAQFDEAHASDPIPYSMWIKNTDPFADPHFYMSEYVDPEGSWGQVHGFAQGYEDPERITSLIAEAKVELDLDRRAELYAELQRILYDDPMWIIAAQEGAVMAYSEDVEGFVRNPLWPRPNIKFKFLSK